MMNKILTLSLVVFTLTGCSLYHIDSSDTSNTYYPPKASIDEIAVLNRTDRDHEIVGYVTVNTERRQSGNEVIAKMKTEAAELGGDAIIDMQEDSTGAWKRIPWQKFIGNGYVRANFKATIIAFK